MPQAPNVDGLPVWLQVTVSLAFVLITGWVGWVGYLKRVEREPPGAAQTLVAAFPDMAAVRQLTEQCRLLCHAVESLDSGLRDNTHYLRNKLEVDAELSSRVRELRDEIVRSDRQRAERKGH